MADENRTPSRSLTLADQLHDEPYAFDFYQAIRRLDCTYPNKPQTGHSTRAIDDPFRLGQEASMAFAPATLQSFEDREDLPPRLVQRFLGLLGPQGALPLHLTEYIRDRLRNHDDYTLLRFLDVFHHRMLALFYRAWARVRPSVSFDNATYDRYSDYVGSLFGLGMRSSKNRDAFPDLPKRHFAGLMSCQTRHPDGLLAILSGYFRLPVQIEEFVGQWVELPTNCRCLLGCSSAKLGVDTIVGSHIWDCQQKFRVVLGPLTLEEYYRMLPGESQISSTQEDENPLFDPSPGDANSKEGRLPEGVGEFGDEFSNVPESVSQLGPEESTDEPGIFGPNSRTGLPISAGNQPFEKHPFESESTAGEEFPEADEPSRNEAEQPVGAHPLAAKQRGPGEQSRANGTSAQQPFSSAPRTSDARNFSPAKEPGRLPGRGNVKGNPATFGAEFAAALNANRPGGTDRFQHSVPPSLASPRGVSLDRLISAVRSYAGDEWQWDLQLVLLKEETPPIGLGIVGNLGWSSWVIRDHMTRNPSDLVLDPTQKPSSGQRIEFRYVRDWSHATLGQMRDGRYILATVDVAGLTAASSGVAS